MRVAERCRVIVDNDWAGDPDGLVALAHHLLSPANRVVLVTSSFLNPMFDPPAGSAAAGSRLARELVELIRPEAAPPVVDGAEDALGDGAPSAAARAIVEEAAKNDPLPLLLVCGGPLTNVAEALRLAPELAGQLTLVWIGGALDPAAFEYNRDTDRAAADAVLGVEGLAVQQFPLEAYRSCTYSVAELEHDLGGCGPLGAWLWERFLALPLPEDVQIGGAWPLGDSPPVLITALGSTFGELPGTGTAERRVHTEVDFRLLVGDMLARFRLHARQARVASRDR